ncbi:MAG: OB-fold domain-containing protein [Chloroflexi bacterium]|nr:OB-fold domain-containing protein [Chloroflexota bacterium]
MTTEQYKRPVPVPDEVSTPFWEGCKKHELLIIRCSDCGYYIHWPKQRCPQCWSTNVAPAKVSGRGTVYSYTIYQVEGPPGFKPPYSVVLVSLEEQEDVRICSNLEDCPLDQIKIGMPVEVFFRDVPEEDVSIPLFRPRKGTK